MGIAQQTVEYIKKTYYDKRVTQEELADLWGVSQNYICKILSGKADPEKISIGVLQRIFPHATLNIDGSPSVKGFGNVVGNNNSDIAINASNVLDHLNAIRDSVVENEKLSADAKVEVLKIIKASLTK